MNHKQVTSLWSAVIIEELIRQGAGFFCISPGSRSTPLTLAAASHPKAEFRIFADERSAAFFALGYARALHKPAVLICTSGTAVANYFPAIIEASTDSQPMIVLSADRPFELLETGANQTIRQHNIFGNYCRWNFQFPAPSTDTPLTSVLSAVDHAVKRSLGAPAGPVHLNVPFREPLEPETYELSSPWAAPVKAWMESASPWSRFENPVKRASDSSIAVLRRIIAEAVNPFIVAGNLVCRKEAEAVETLARALNIPLFADLTSGIRLSAHTRPWQLAFQTENFTGKFRPDLVLHFGGAMIGRQPAQAIRGWAPDHYIVVREHPDRFGPDHNVTMSIEAAPAAVAEALAGCREPFMRNIDEDTFFTRASEVIDGSCRPELPVTEISASRIVSRLVGTKNGLFVSNSMPAREMDMFGATSQEPPIRTALNRGVSGIDGIISTATGFAAGLRKPVTLIIGDISFLHDLNALSLLGDKRNHLVVVVLNNNGGGIFSFLPIAATGNSLFEECFATPQNFSVSSAAETFGIEYAHPGTNGEFTACYTAALQSDRTTIIEVTGTREENHHLHQKLKARITNLFPSIE
jgi:2-succinyl-5-enolpyruvyl-6-hydroxy-3-cyclohexene-1-carboxylate synthase